MSAFSRTAVLGCGLMGSAIIRTLHGKGHAVVGWNRSVAPLLPLQEAGIQVTTDLSSAVAGSDVVVTVLSSYDVVRSVLGTIGLPQLSGKIIVNLSSGSAQDARDMREWAHDRNAEYVDGSIWVLPNMIGAPDTVLSCAGPIELWERIEHTIKLLGGASFHAGEAIENGNVLEACFPGAFYMTAQHCFVESLVRAKRLGIDLNVITRAVSPSMRLLQNSLDDLLSKIAIDDISAYEASLDVWSHAAEGYGKISSAAGLHSPFLDVLRGQLRSAVDAGLGPRGAAAVVAHLE
ncbi:MULTISPECIES: NAD(P)-binding domain-containing protein [unclassified Rhizobium]|uniref:NAD(P)-dependent oxidoreductase n=1 Tax=unclassified Rhizobium TaxID=2613769 RepID=UPI0006FF8A38|nr:MULTISPECIES: NAD(P)-binding domain-containing protein [unclassified Rhizobium]KQV39344.1 hypothetical protein ASC86_22670 [Rhizobium sp. Root1212]KRD35349.1 hypothetical protein ASE37_21240 [Rhizobium sp. Root268]